MIATDLKIGNYVYRGEEPEIRNVTSIDCSSGTYSGVYLNESLGRTLLAEINPIPLTKQHLIKFGFYELLEGRYTKEWFPFSLEYIDDENEIEPYWGVGYNQALFHVKIRFVHELQNMVYSFTNMPLILN